MKDSYVLRLPYEEKVYNKIIQDKFIINSDDVKALKFMAKEEGRSLRTFVTYKLKEIAKPNLLFIKDDIEDK